jgi:serine phosphatase RsbU (regulator of sigma subunit)
MLIIAALMIQVSGAVQFFFARNGIRKEVDVRAQSEMKMKSLKIQQMLSNVESAVDNINWMLEWSVENPENMYPIMEEFVKCNSNVQGCALAFEPDFFPDKGHWYEPYVLRDANGDFKRMQIADSTHDYFSMSWYKEGLESESGRWTEPYIDNEGAQGMICTYAFPIKNAKGEVVAVFAADVSLNWLTDEFVTDKESKSYSFIVSREGRILACPDKSKIMNYTLDDAAAEYQDTAIRAMNRALLAGESGKAEAKDNNGELAYMYYSPVEGKSGWSMAIIYPDREIYKGLRSVALKLVIMMLVGLALMIYIMWRTVKGFKRLEVVSAEKERIGSELRIASDIQNGMLPKTFPPYPDLEELALYGALMSAKEVGGDLYDFYVRDYKAFFCIGDVSGKGVPASLLMAVTRSLFRSFSSRIDDPGEIISQVNNAMSEMNENSMFVTLFVGVLDLHTGNLTYSNAGHCAPVLLGGEPTFLAVDANIPVGVMSEWQFSSQQTTINPGQTVFLYTDGLTEAENANLEQFGEERMLKVLGQSDTAPRPLVENILQTVKTFVGTTDQSDDLTMLAIHFAKTRRNE